MARPSELEGGHAAVEAATARYYNCICRHCPQGTPYRQQADRFVNEPLGPKRLGVPSRELALIGVLAALKADIAAGALATFEERIHGDVYADLLAMADGLCTTKHYRAAATIAGAALEEHLRKLAIKSGIPVASKANTINADLKRAGVYGNPIHGTIEGYQKIRNAAAHGDPGFELGDVTLVQYVQPMIVGVRALLAQYPA